MGVFPTGVKRLLLPSGLPHVRGGVSNWKDKNNWGQESSPRPWGCFLNAGHNCQRRRVFPTSVGVFPRLYPLIDLWSCLPHVRGGVSSFAFSGCLILGSSPRPWGCFPLTLVHFLSMPVFPTSVGVFLITIAITILKPGLPHVRGGVSFPWCKIGRRNQSSPRPWGCFSRRAGSSHLDNVFPTSVGVFPGVTERKNHQCRLPHVRGGVSLGISRGLNTLLSSPRPWGCF